MMCHIIAISTLCHSLPLPLSSSSAHTDNTHTVTLASTDFVPPSQEKLHASTLFVICSSTHSITIIHPIPFSQEKLHASTLFVICSSTPEANVFELLSPEQFTHARKLIIDAILDTDMACHFSR